MAANQLLPCPAFIPMNVHGEYFCARCGLSYDYHHQGEQQGMVFLPVANYYQVHPQVQRPYPPLPLELQQPPVGQAHGVIPHNWHDLPLVHLVHPPPAEYLNQVHVGGNNNNNNGREGELPQGIPSIRAWAFTEHQVNHMFVMAVALQWSLSGRFGDPELHRFCEEIGVTWSQFVNWVNRNRGRYAGFQLG